MILQCSVPSAGALTGTGRGSMKCPRCHQKLEASEWGRVMCLNLRCTWTSQKELREMEFLGERVYWRPGFEEGLNRVPVADL